jgi:hypothetical protein
MLALARKLHDGHIGINEKMRMFDYDISRKHPILGHKPGDGQSRREENVVYE